MNYERIHKKISWCHKSPQEFGSLGEERPEGSKTLSKHCKKEIKNY